MIPNSTLLKISSGLYLKPKISSGTRFINLVFTRHSFSYSTGIIMVNVLPNSLISASVTPVSLIVSETTSYNFGIIINN